jgi:hypothetical protein
MSNRGSDLDTFFQPSGDIVTSGTDGLVDRHALAVRQHVDVAHSRTGAFGMSVGYTRDVAVFPPDVRVVTHTQPRSETREFITARETTISEVFDVGLHGRKTWSLGARWRAAVDVDASPAMRARLVTGNIIPTAHGDCSRDTTRSV